MTSPRTASRLSRILAMLPWVIAHPGATVEEVCRRFGYTRRELLDDLDLVFVCGLPGYGPGDLMVAYVEEDEVVVDMAEYFSRSLRLSPAEALSLLASGLALLGTGQAPPALERAVEKLSRAILPDGTETLAIDLADEPELVGTLRQAASDHEVVHITYTSLTKEETTERDVEPWMVFSALGNWYLSAHCRRAGGERIFRVDRIRQAEITGEAFHPPSEPPPAAIRYTPAEEDIRAVIKLAAPARWVAEYYPVEMIEEDDATMTVRFSSPDALVPARLLLRLGDQAELLEGEEVRERLEELRERILTRYTA